MDAQHAQFVGSIPEIYDQHLGPLFFEFSGRDLARRVAAANPGRVLELAAGTGIATELMREVLPDHVGIVATDLQPAMVDFARAKRGGLANVRFDVADARDLAYGDAEFDAVAVQFGFMFLPDKVSALRGMARVLRPGGLLIFNVWDSWEVNEMVGIVRRIATSFFPDNPPSFLDTAFGCHAIDPMKAAMQEVGFRSLDIHVVHEIVERPVAGDVARGLLTGNPAHLEILERGGDIEAMVRALTDALAERFGPEPLRIPLQEIVFEARKPL